MDKERGFYRRILAIALPIMIQNGITNFVNLLDNIMVGQLGVEQMAGASIVNQLIFVYNLCIFGGLAGAGIFTTQYYGAEDKEGLQNTVRYKLWLAFGITVLAGLILGSYGTELIKSYLVSGDTGLTLQAGSSYLRILLWSMPAFALVQVYVSTLKECGETRLPMWASMISVFTNLVLNYLLIYGKYGFPKMGIKGAAAATVAARFVELGIVLMWPHGRKAYSFTVGLYRTLKVPWKSVKVFVWKGFPLLINEALWASAMAVLTGCYAKEGLVTVAALSIANTLNNLLNIIFGALGETVAILVGQLLGAGRMKEAKKADDKLLLFCVASGGAVLIVMMLIAPVFPKLYQVDETTRGLASAFIRVQGLYAVQSAFLNGAYFTLRAGGKTKLTFLFDCGFIWMVNIPVAFVLVKYTGFSPVLVYAIVQGSEILKVGIGYLLVKKEIWIQNIVLET